MEFPLSRLQPKQGWELTMPFILLLEKSGKIRREEAATTSLAEEFVAHGAAVFCNKPPKNNPKRHKFRNFALLVLSNIFTVISFVDLIIHMELVVDIFSSQMTHKLVTHYLTYS